MSRPAALSIRTAVIFYAAVGLAAVGLGRLSGRGCLLVLPGSAFPPGSPGQLFRSLLLGLACGMAVVVVLELARPRLALLRRLERVVGRMLPRLGIGGAVILAAASAIAEELLFRGLLTPAIGTVGSALLFALFHLGPGREFLAWAGFALAAGLMLGLLFVETGSLIAPIACHFAVNAANLWLIDRRRPAGW